MKREINNDDEDDETEEDSSSGLFYELSSNQYDYSSKPSTSNSYPSFAFSTSDTSENLSLVELGKRLLGASRDGDKEEVRSLMTKGAPFTTDWLGTSPLHYSALNGHASTVEILLRAGIFKDARTKVDKTPLHLAAQEGHTDVVEALLNSGCDVDAGDMLRMTPLHWAVERGNVNSVEMLLRFGASTTLESKFGKTPLEIASDNGRPDIFEMLQNAERFRAISLYQSESDAATVAATQSIMTGESSPNDSISTSTSNPISPSNKNEVMKLLEAQGITLLPEESPMTLSDGQSLELTEAGKLAFGMSSLKPTNIVVSGRPCVKKKSPQQIQQQHRTITKIVTLNSSSSSTSSTKITTPLSGGKFINAKTRVITLTPQQFAAIKSGKSGNLSEIINNCPSVGDKRKTISAPKMDSRKIKIVPLKLKTSMSAATDMSNTKVIRKVVTSSLSSDHETLKRHLEAELQRKEEETNRIKDQLKSLYASST